MAQLLYANQFVVTRLNVGGGINNSQTTGIFIEDTSLIDTTKPSIALIEYSDPVDTSKAEWVEYTSIDGSKQLVGVTRGAEGFSAKSHNNSVSVAFPVSESHINRIVDKLNGTDTGLILNAPKISNRRITTAADATSITPNTDNADITYQASTQGAGTLTINADAGTPTNGQLWELWLKPTNAQTLSFNAQFIAMGTALPTSASAGKNLKVLFQWDSGTSKWGCLASNQES